MYPYYVLLGLTLVLGIEARNKDYLRNLMGKPHWGGYTHTADTRVCFVIISLLIILMTGLRYKVGTDYYIYTDLASDFSGELETRLLTLREPGYSLITRLSSYITPDPALPIFVCAAIIGVLLMTTIYRNSGDLLFSVLLYLFIVLAETMHVVRQYTAVAIVFSAYTYARDRKIVPYMLCVFAAFLFHVSAIFMVFAYFFFDIKLNWKTLLIMAVGSVAVYLLSEPVLNLAIRIIDKDVPRDMDVYVTSMNVLRVIAFAAPALLMVWIYRGRRLTYDEAFCLKGVLLHGCLAVATSHTMYMFRVCWYTAPFICIAIPELMKGVKGTNRKIITLILLAAFCLYWFHDLTTHPSLSHFQWLWQR